MKKRKPPTTPPAPKRDTVIDADRERELAILSNAIDLLRDLARRVP